MRTAPKKMKSTDGKLFITDKFGIPKGKILEQNVSKKKLLNQELTR